MSHTQKHALAGAEHEISSLAEGTVRYYFRAGNGGGSGVFKAIENADYRWGFGSSGEWNGIYAKTFNASASNSIYGNSNTVQPPAIHMPFVIVAL